MKLAETADAVKGHQVGVVGPLGAVPYGAADGDDVVVLEEPVDVLKGVVLWVAVAEDSQDRLYRGDPAGSPMFINEESPVSIIIGEGMFSRKFKVFDPVVRETQSGRTRELRAADTPGRTSRSLVPLYVGYESEN